MNSIIKISKQEARNFLINRSFIAQKAESLGEVLEVLSCIQVDPMQVVGKSHEIALWNRIKKFTRKEFFDELYSKRTVFEYWLQLYSVIPIESFPFLKIRMQIENQWHGEYFKLHEKQIRKVLDFVHENGPTKATDLSHIEGGASVLSWKDGNSQKALLEFLWDRGDLIIYSREKNNKVFDLPERHINKNILENAPSEEESLKFLLKSQFKYFGLFRRQQISSRARYLAPKLRKLFDSLLNKGEIIKVKIQDVKTDYYIFSSEVNNFQEQIKNNSHTGITILSPLDPLIIDRTQLEDIFDFYYRWEAYVPAKKRLVGPYGMPILENGKFIGQVQFQKNKNKELEIQKLIMTGKNKNSIKKEIEREGKVLSEFLNN